MTERDQKQLGKVLWSIADQLRGAMNADDFRDYMLAFLFLRYLSDNYEAAARRELGKDYPDPSAVGNGGRSSLSVWYADNPGDVAAFEKQMRRKAHYVIKPEHLWTNIAHLARTQNAHLLNTLQAGFTYIELVEIFEAANPGLLPSIVSKGELTAELSADPDRFPRSKAFVGGVYFKTHASVHELRRRLRKIAERAGIGQTDYAFVMPHEVGPAG